MNNSLQEKIHQHPPPRTYFPTPFRNFPATPLQNTLFAQRFILLPPNG
jgi:hypothetical protein